MALETSLCVFVLHMEQFNIWVFHEASVSAFNKMACKQSDLLLHRGINDSCLLGVPFLQDKHKKLFCPLFLPRASFHSLYISIYIYIFCTKYRE